MDSTQVFDRVVQHVGEYLESDVSHLKMDSQIETALPGLDSLKRYEMLLYLEECFSIEFDEESAQKLVSMGDLVTYIQSRLPAAVPAQ